MRFLCWWYNCGKKPETTKSILSFACFSDILMMFCCILFSKRIKSHSLETLKCRPPMCIGSDHCVDALVPIGASSFTYFLGFTAEYPLNNELLIRLIINMVHTPKENGCTKYKQDSLNSVEWRLVMRLVPQTLVSVYQGNFTVPQDHRKWR